MVTMAYPDHDLYGEPSLEEMFGDPMVRMVMTRDGVEEQTMRRTIERLRDAYKGLLEAQ
jgi:hypothetical protein